MSHPTGTYLGGIRTVACLRERCFVDPESGCWQWRLSFSNGLPRVHLPHPTTGKKVAMRGRRAALVLLHGKDLPRGHVAFAASRCDSIDCVNPEHCRSGTLKAWGKSVQGREAHRTPAKVASARAAGLRRRKMTQADVDLIRSRPDLSIAKLAKMVGRSEFAVWSVRKGKTWRESAQPVNSVWRLAA